MGEASSYIDQLGNDITLDGTPSTIVSLVPSITELLVDLGLRKELIGCTKFCTHPEGLKKDIKVIGGTKSIHMDRVAALCPDLIIANKEENKRESICELQKNHNVWVSDVKTVSDAYDMIVAIGQITNTAKRANEIIAHHKSMFTSFKKKSGRVIYLIWKDPWMTVGGDTYINDMLEHVGYTNVYKQLSRYPTVDLELIKSTDIDMIFLSSEPFPFSAEHKVQLQKKFPKVSVKLVDGEFFSWYGSRLVHKNSYLTDLNIQELSQN